MMGERRLAQESARADGAFDRRSFRFDRDQDHYTCPAGKQLRRFRRTGYVDHERPNADGFFRYRASKLDCDVCALKPQCCPGAEARKVMRSIHEGARDMARTLSQEDEWITSRRERKKVEMLFAHLKRIMRSTACDYAVPTVLETSSTSPQQPRTSASWPRSASPTRHCRPEGVRSRSTKIPATVRFCQKPTFSTASTHRRRPKVTGLLRQVS